MSYELITKHDSNNFTPAAQVPRVYGRKRTVESITIHWWGLPEWNATFDGTVSFLCTNTKPTSAHEVIEAGRVAVIVAHGDAAWAAGNAAGNATSIHLELNPRASDADYLTAAERIRDIRAEHGKDLPLIPHRDWQATMCPGNYDLARLDRLARGGTVTTQSASTTPVEDDEMTVEDTQYMKEKLARLEELSLSFEKVLTDPVSGVIKQAAEITLKGGVGSRYVRSEVTGEDTVYERTDDGKLRPIGLAEFQLAMKSGETYRLVPKWMIDALPKAA